MAKMYITFEDPVKEEGKLAVTVSCLIIGAAVPGIAITEYFAGEPTPTAITTAVRDKALREANVYLTTGKLTAGDIVMFCAPS